MLIYTSSFPRQLSWQSRGLKILVSLVRFRFWALSVHPMPGTKNFSKKVKKVLDNLDWLIYNTLCCQRQTLAGVVQWQNTSLPSWIRGFDSHHPLSTEYQLFMHEWLSGGVSPCQGEGRGFESRLVLFCYLKSGAINSLLPILDFKSVNNLHYLIIIWHFIFYIHIIFLKIF